MNQQEKNEAAVKVIEALGGTAAVARIFGLEMPSVSDWKKDGIPGARMMFLRVAKAKQLRGIDLAAATSAGTKKRRPTAATAAESA